jgi:dTMP kinase
MLLINIDGADGTGKTTLINELINYYGKLNKKIGYIHFPRYDTELGKIIKEVLLKKRKDMHPAAFQMICSADRVNWSIYDYPKLAEQYDIILVDRHSSSGIVYGQIDGLDVEEILCNDKHIIQPNAHIILIADTETSLVRMARRDEEVTKYENVDGVRKATDKFLELKNILPNVYYINANKSIDYVLSEAIKIINTLGDDYE